MPTAPLSAKEVAAQLDTDARTLRKFLRDTTPKEDQPGQGGRWTFTPAQAKKLGKKFAEWSTNGAKAKATATAEKKISAKKSKIEEPEEIEDFEDELLDLEDLDDPDEDELDEDEDEDEDEE